MRYTLLLAATLLIPGCFTFRIDGPPTMFGDRHVTELGIPFWFFAASGPYDTPDSAGAAIDEAFRLWSTLEPGFTQEGLLVVAKCVEIQLYPGGKVPGDDLSLNYAGYYWPQGIIEVAMDRRWTDIYMNLDHVGVLTLRHEWRHALRGAWHP